MKRILAVLLASMMLLGLLAGCGSDNGTNSNGEGGTSNGSADVPKEDLSQVTTRATEMLGFTLADKQEIRSVYSGEVSTLNYLTTTSTGEFGLCANFIDSLVDYDQYGVMVPGLAASWEISDDGLTYTFHIRENATWVTWKGEYYANVTADDFVAGLEYVLDRANGSTSAGFAYPVIKNAKAYYMQEITDFSQVGVKAVDERTLVYTLEEPCPYFLSLTSYMCFWPVCRAFLEEVGDDFGTYNDCILYCGAYIFSEFEPQVRKVRTKNPSYWDIENVHITKITSTYNKEAAAVSPDLYLRGEITSLDVPSSLLQDWMNDPEKKDMIRPSSLSFYSYFYCLNFDPHFSEDYEPENWKKAVNTTSFRRCLFYALDRHGALMTVDPYDPDHIIINTFTPPDFVAMDGSDFVNIGGMAKYTNDENNLFNPDLALELKEQAVADLTAKGVTFPIKILMPYNGGATWGNRCQVIKQQMESLLGSDFIEVCFEAYSSSFLDSTRRCGNYAMQECNEEATFADPDTFSMMFDEDNNFSFFYACEEVDENGKNLFDVYMEKLNYAKSQTTDLSERYKAFADAEAYLLDNAIAIPFGLGVLGAGYTSSHTNPFEGAWSPLGVSNERYKYSYVYNETMNSEQYYKLQEQWEKDKIAALQAAGQ